MGLKGMIAMVCKTVPPDQLPEAIIQTVTFWLRGPVEMLRAATDKSVIDIVQRWLEELE